jgi:hypothetical protein
VSTLRSAAAHLIRWAPRVSRSTILRLYEQVALGILDEAQIDEVIAFLENLPYGPSSGPEMSAQLATWRRRCLSEFRARDAEYARVQAQVEGVPPALRAEIEALIAANRQQQAVARLAQIPAYRGELQVLSGDMPREMVKLIKREMKQRRSAV